ncbi:MAG: alpha/beta hydrolase [Lapillicoccus sp.]
MPGSHLPGDLTIRIVGRDEPDAPTLVLLHGLTDSGACWPDAVRRWSADYRIVTWDARGHGDSPRFLERELEDGVGETHLADLIALLGTLADHGILRPVLVGHSMGGGTAAAVAGVRPDLVRAVVLEDPALGVESPDDAGQGGRDRGPDRARERVADALETLVDPAAALATGRLDHPSWPVSEFDPWLAAKLAIDIGMLENGAVTSRRPRLDVAAAIAVPTLLVTGDRDVIWMPPLLERLAAVGNPHIEVGVVTGARHCVRRDVADGFHAVVDPWIAARFEVA